VRAVRIIVLALACPIGVGCGGDDDGGAAGDGGQADDGSPEADAPIDAAGPRRIADSVIFVGRGAAPLIRFSDDPEGPGSCLSEPVAGCEIQTCTAEPSAPPRPDAGAVSITPAGGGGESYLPDAEGTYPTAPVVTWEVGETVTVEAEGGEVPAFSLDAVGPADVLSVVAPVFPNPVIPRDQALLVEWTGAESFAAIAIRCPTGDPVQVRCPFPDGTTGQVPVAALRRLPACAGASVNVFTEDRHVVEPGPVWPIRVGLRGAILTTTATIE
jgi:hypothetical protein